MVAGDYEWATLEALLATLAKFKRQSNAFMCATHDQVPRTFGATF
jgi:hypothetical protein